MFKANKENIVFKNRLNFMLLIIRMIKLFFSFEHVQPCSRGKFGITRTMVTRCESLLKQPMVNL